MNRVKTVLLLGLLTGLFLAVGGAIGGRTGLVIALLLAGAMNFFSYWYSDKMVLRMYRARPVERAAAPELYDIVQGLADSAGLPMPAVYIIDQDTPNAFATGRDPQHAAVAVTSGIMRILSARELRGVLGHELAHVKDRDILVSTVAATLAGAVMVLASLARWSLFFGGSDDEEGGLGIIGVLAMSILAPLAAMLVQMAVSRSREYLADSEGAGIAGDPQALAAALAKLEQGNLGGHVADAHPATAHMFIVNPLSSQRLAGLFSTHPPTAERIARLQAMAGGRAGSGRGSDRPLAPPPPPPPPPPANGRDSFGNQGRIDWS